MWEKKLSDDHEARLVVALVCAFIVGVAGDRLLGFRTRATTVGGLGIEPQVICPVNPGAVWEFLD